MPKDTLQTLIEILNHCVTQHPELATHVSRIASSALGDDTSQDISEWASRAYAAPSPHFIKQAVILRNNLSNATWIETGTHLGDTAAFLSLHAKFVHTIEPAPDLHKKAKERFLGLANVMVHNEISETAFPHLLPTLSGNVCFWLDGHYSGEGTFAGPNDTPLRTELKFLTENMHKYNNVAILIDDIRLCGRLHSYGEYPSLNELVEFAIENNLNWYIEHDIFIAKSK